MKDIDTANYQLVGSRGLETVTVMMPRRDMTPAEALVHAAWLVITAEALTPGGPSFEDARKAVLSS